MIISVIDLIPIGSKNAITREALLNKCTVFGIAFNDRQMRKLIEDARAENCILNLSDGRGYFIPDKNDQDKLRHYVNQEHDRSMTILRNLKMARAMLEDLEYERI